MTRAENGGTQTDLTLNYAAALGAGVGGAFTLFGEMYGNFAFGEGIPDSHLLQAGTAILLGRIWQVDVWVGIGIVDARGHRREAAC